MRILVIALAGVAFLAMMFAILGPFERYGPVLDQPTVGVAYRIVCDQIKGNDYAVTMGTKDAAIAYARSVEEAHAGKIDAEDPKATNGASGATSAIPDGTTVRVIDEEPKWGGWGEILILEGDRAGETAFINIPDQKYEELEGPERPTPTLSRLGQH